MSDLPTPSVPSASLSTTAIIAIATGIGISLICIIALIVLLARAVRNHKQLLADLEARGISTARAQGEARDSVARPRAVLRRNTVLPYNKNSGWDTLTSVETLKSGETPGAVEHYVPPKPIEAVKGTGRLSWPFHAKSMSGHNIHLKKIKGSRLSTVLEDPKPSALVPVLRSSHLDSRRPPMPLSPYGSRPTSAVSLLQYHPALRSPDHQHELASQDEPSPGISFFRTEANERLQRAKSVAAVPSAETTRPQLRVRSTSLCSHASGRVPDVILPPLPLDIARIKSEASRRSQLKRVPSKQSLSSIGSADTSILASRVSPIITSTTKRRPQKITKPRTRGSTIGGTRPFRDSLDLRAKVMGLRHNTDSPSRTTAANLEMEDPYVESKSTSSTGSGSRTPGVVDRAQSFDMNKMSSPTISPLAVLTLTTPKHKSKRQAYSEGSPERPKRIAATSKVHNGVGRSPKRQHSQTSSRSSGGNPFQWDPTPLSSTGKPSALKGSPSARQGHRRKNSVRISLVPTVHGPPAKTSRPSSTVENQDDTTAGATAGATATAPAPKAVAGLGIAVSSTRALPTPPTSSTFAPELKLPTTSLRASLTSTSPTLPLVGYDQPYVVFPTDQILNKLSNAERNRTSYGSALSLSKFPETPSIIEPSDMDNYEPLLAPSSLPYDFGRDFQMPDTPYLHQHPFRPETPEHERDLSQSSLIDLDDYSPEHRNMIFQTPTNAPSRAWQSAFAAIPEESSISSQKTYDAENSHADDDSSSISPKTLSPPRFNLDDRSAYNLPVYATTILEDTPDTIDPTILCKDTFMLLNSSMNDVHNSIISAPNSKHSSLAFVIPTTPDLAQSMFEPLLQAAFSSSSPLADSFESPVLGHRQSDPSSIYSMPSPPPSLSPTTSPIELPSPVMPCSPRPSHAQLPNQGLALNFAELPKLNPSPQGPRSSPPRPLRTSIAALRRMNSDAANAKKEKAGRGERRYLRFGREVSTPTPGEESWSDDMEDDDNNVELTEEAGRRLVSNVLDEHHEGCTMLQLDRSNSMQSTSTITPNPEIYAPDSLQADTTSGAEEYSGSIWGDGERFWTSPTPPRTDSPDQSQNCHQFLQSSLLASPALFESTPKSSKKRDFEVAKDSPPVSLSPTENTTPDHDCKKRRESIDDAEESGASGNNYRKRTVLGVSTPNVQIQVTSPGGRVMTGTLGSLYDAQGFLRY
jgi:hypothetical protein